MKQVRTVTTRVVKTTIRLDRRELTTLLASAGFKFPKHAAMYVQVPGGGDWSNMALDLGSDNPLVIEWEEQSCEVDEGDPVNCD